VNEFISLPHLRAGRPRSLPLWLWETNYKSIGRKAILLQTINFTKLARYYKLIKFVASKSLGSLDEPVWDFVLLILFSACRPILPARFFPPFIHIFYLYLYLYLHLTNYSQDAAQRGPPQLLRLSR
jgi:hypothetical protein